MDDFFLDGMKNSDIHTHPHREWEREGGEIRGEKEGEGEGERDESLNIISPRYFFKRKFIIFQWPFGKSAPAIQWVT